MPRNITVTFEDGSTHVYQNAPDNITPDMVTARAQKDFNKSVTALDGGRGEVPGPRQTGQLADQIPGYGKPVPAVQTPIRTTPATTGEKIMGAIEVAPALIANAVTAPIVDVAKVYGTLTSGKYGTQEGIRAGEETGRRVASQIQYQPRTATGQEYTAAIGNALAQTGLQGVPLNVLADFQRAAAPTAQLARDALRNEANLVRESVAAPMAARAERRQLDLARQSQINAPRIDAAKDAVELGIALDPAVSNPTRGNKFKSRIVGAGNLDAKLAEQNLPVFTSQAKRDMGLPDTVKLDAKAFETARSAPEVSKPYEAVRGMSTLAPDADTFAQLDNLRVAPLIGDTGQAAAANSLLDAVKQQLSTGVDGRTLVDSIRQRRREAQAIYNQQSKGVNPPSPEALAKADINMGVANVLEGMIENNITNNPTLLGDFRNARAALAKTYDYERATNFATGNIDPQVIAKMAAEGKPMSGTLAKIGNVAANYPEVSRADVSKKAGWGEKLTRSSPGGTVGAVIGAPFGLMGSIVGGATGAAIGNVATALEARRMATPGYQARHAIPRDYRPPVNNLRPAEINYAPNQLAPYDFGQQVLTPEQMPYQPNFVFGRGTPDVRATMPQTPPMLAAPSAESTLGALRAEDVRRAGVSRVLGQQAEAEAAAAEAAANVGKRTTNRPTELMFDEAGNLVPAQAQGAGGVVGGLTPLESAVQKMSGQVTPETTGTTFKTTRVTPKTGAEPYTRVTRKGGETSFERQGQAFAMTAEEKIAWNKAKADLAEVAPGFKALSDKAIAEKMLDRAWVEQTAAAARQKAAAFEQLAARAADERARQTAMANRERMMDLAEQMEDTLRAPRPDVSGKQQGPKTRAAKRNMLRPEGLDIENALAK